LKSGRKWTEKDDKPYPRKDPMGVLTAETMYTRGKEAIFAVMGRNSVNRENKNFFQKWRVVEFCVDNNSSD
jgi:hypothetical protein